MRILVLAVLFLLSLPQNVSSQTDTLAVEGDFFKTYYLVNGEVVKKKEFRRILKMDAEAKRLWQRGSWYDAASGVFAVTGVVLLASTQPNDPNNPPYWWQWAGGFGSTGAAIALAFPASRLKLRAIEVYNRNAVLRRQE